MNRQKVGKVAIVGRVPQTRISISLTLKKTQSLENITKVKDYG